MQCALQREVEQYHQRTAIHTLTPPGLRLWIQWIEVEFEGPGGQPRPHPSEIPPRRLETEDALDTVRLLKKQLGESLRVRG